MMCRWTTRGAHRLTQPGARPPREHLDGWFQHDGAVSTWLARFLEAWAGDASAGGRGRTPGRGRTHAPRRWRPPLRVPRSFPPPRAEALLSALTPGRFRQVGSSASQQFAVPAGIQNSEVWSSSPARLRRAGLLNGRLAPSARRSSRRLLRRRIRSEGFAGIRLRRRVAAERPLRSEPERSRAPARFCIRPLPALAPRRSTWRAAAAPRRERLCAAAPREPARRSRVRAPGAIPPSSRVPPLRRGGEAVDAPLGVAPGFPLLCVRRPGSGLREISASARPPPAPAAARARAGVRARPRPACAASGARAGATAGKRRASARRIPPARVCSSPSAPDPAVVAALRAPLRPKEARGPARADRRGAVCPRRSIAPRPRPSRSASRASSSERTGTLSSAAAVGVGARMSAA